MRDDKRHLKTPLRFGPGKKLREKVEQTEKNLKQVKELIKSV